MAETYPKPMLAPNSSPDLDKINYPILASHKLDGIRFFIFDGKMLSRKMEPLPDATIKRFQRVIDWAKETGVCLDGEVWSTKLAFNQISSVMSYPIVNDDLKLYVFDILPINEWYANRSWKDREVGKDLQFEQRATHYKKWCEEHDPEQKYVVPVEQRVCTDTEQVKAMQQEVKTAGGEGLMLKAPDSYYLHSRATANQNIFCKLKFWETVNCKIVGFKQGVSLTEEAKKNNTDVDAFGHAKRGHRKGDRVAVDVIGAIEVEITSGQTFPVGTRTFASFAKEANDLYKAVTWENREQFIGKHADLLFQEHGSLNKPRLGRITRFRPDLD